MAVYDATRPADHTVVNGPGPDPQQPVEHVTCSWCATSDAGTGAELTSRGWVVIAGTDSFFCRRCWPTDIVEIVQ